MLKRFQKIDFSIKKGHKSDLKDAKEMIGHSDISMTDRYSHLTALHKRSRQERLAEHDGN
jgi:site-specific recombinase XerD